MHKGQGNGRTKSEAWAQPTPLTLSDALSKLDSLKAQLTPAQLGIRLEYFDRAEANLRIVAATGGVCAPYVRSFPKPDENGVPDQVRKNGIRVDIDVKAGQAFVP